MRRAGFSTDVAVTNRSVPPPNGVVNLILDDGQRPSVWWGANTSIGGPDPHMTFTLPAFHPDVAIGETYHFGYNATYTGAYDQAYAFRLGGQLCDIEYVTL
ncbi:cellulose binding domain-containing protein [Nonomuraea sp. NPDC049695]|uniref:cellulose binding domain-containing protein n=1 Tax=Nonomuraea sp. NPDC049695 TaxID=3154734 RepID=UPI00343E02AA